jgi:hypothetical protein
MGLLGARAGLPDDHLASFEPHHGVTPVFRVALAPAVVSGPSSVEGPPHPRPLSPQGGEGRTNLQLALSELELPALAPLWGEGPGVRGSLSLRSYGSHLVTSPESRRASQIGPWQTHILKWIRGRVAEYTLL